MSEHRHKISNSSVEILHVSNLIFRCTIMQKCKVEQHITDTMHFLQYKVLFVDQ